MTWEVQAQFPQDQCQVMVRVDLILIPLLEEEEEVLQMGWEAQSLWVLLPTLSLNLPVHIPMECQGDIDLFLLLQNYVTKPLPSQ